VITIPAKITNVILLVIFASSVFNSAAAQTNSQKRASANQSVVGPATERKGTLGGPLLPAKTTEASPQELLKLTIGSSRASVTRDGSYGVFADLEDVSKDILTIKAAETMLIVQPEVSQPNACVASQMGIFPAQSTSDQAGSKTSEIHLRPNEHYKVFWDLSRHGQTDPNCSQQSQLKSKLGDILGFVPGDYAFTVEGIAYTPGPAGQPPMAHTYTATTTLNVSISQVLTAFAAFLGALFAYLVVALQPGHDFDRWRSDLPTGDRVKVVGVLIRNAFSAGLLGAAVTIVASRLSDTQFPVKVSVSDFWGALTIGFVAYFVGSRFISTIASRLAVPPTNPAGAKPGAGGTQAGNALPADAPSANPAAG
jgi:hypothetical protein